MILRPGYTENLLRSFKNVLCQPVSKLVTSDSLKQACRLKETIVHISTLFPIQSHVIGLKSVMTGIFTLWMTAIKTVFKKKKTPYSCFLAYH